MEQRHNGEWKTACDDSWGEEEANVVCKQLGHPGYIKAVGSAFFGQGTGTILFDNTGCTGSETKILDCPRVSPHNCGHSEDAGVICQAHVRLAGSSNYYEGRVEAYKDGSWGTVCDHLWDIRDAHVVCRMLGFNGADQVYAAAHFGVGSGTIHYDGLQCDGTESRMLHCPKSPTGSCTHARDAGVKCKVLRLADGNARNEGRVEIFKDDTWGTVCGPITLTKVSLRVCLEISRSAYRNFFSTPHTYGQGTGAIKISNLACTGSEEMILDCPYSSDTSSCTHANDISVICNSGVTIFLPVDEMRGVVSVYRHKTWSPVCANDWDIRDAAVACREMGGLDVIEATAVPRVDSKPATRGGFKCEGYESTLDDCRQESVPETCTHQAGVVCQTLRLVEGSAPHIGLLEIYSSGNWGGVCEHEWDKRDAHVACIQLGFPSGADKTYRVPEEKARTSGYNWLRTVYCSGFEKHIYDCASTKEKNSCAFTEEVWVECIP